MEALHIHRPSMSLSQDAHYETSVHCVSLAPLDCCDRDSLATADSFAADTFGTPSVMSLQEPALVTVHHVLPLYSILCLPPYPNDQLINRPAKYYPDGSQRPLEVIVRRALGKGFHRDVLLECTFPRGQHFVEGVEHGFLLLDVDYGNGQPLFYRPPRWFLAKRFLRDVLRRGWKFVFACVGMRRGRVASHWDGTELGFTQGL
jgi:hypothetical protein